MGHFKYALLLQSLKTKGPSCPVFTQDTLISQAGSYVTSGTLFKQILYPMDGQF